ncbi:GLE1-like protein-domain-containing protein [Zopfochytrium polystomum]|nr:GLE1-like protein-domain-containing protein [Zopfochytrium polystomum]
MRISADFTDLELAVSPAPHGRSPRRRRDGHLRSPLPPAPYSLFGAEQPSTPTPSPPHRSARSPRSPNNPSLGSSQKGLHRDRNRAEFLDAVWHASAAASTPSPAQRRAKLQMECLEKAMREVALQQQIIAKNSTSSLLVQLAALQSSPPPPIDLELKKKHDALVAEGARKVDEINALTEKAIAEYRKRKAAEAAAAAAEQKKEEDRIAAAAKAEQDRKNEETRQREAAAARAVEAQAKAKAEADRVHKERKAAEEAKGAPPPDVVVSQTAWACASGYLALVADIKTIIKPRVKANQQEKNLVFKETMTITKSVGQLTNSRAQILTVARKLADVLSTGGARSEDAYMVLLDAAAKAIAKQADTEVAVQRTKAFPLALVCVLLFDAHPPFRPILLGRLIKRCPQIAPMYMKKRPDETDDDFARRCRYKKDADDNRETEEQFNERMSGIVALYAAILQSTTAKGNQHGMEYAWSWLSRIVNLKPRRVTAHVIQSFLEVAGHAFIKTYGRQAVKLLQFIYQFYIPKMPAECVASATRLSLFLERDFLKTGTMPPMEGSQMDK